MSEIITLEPRLLNFKDNKVQRLTLPQLRNTVKEDDYNNKPIMGMYHWEYIQRALEEVEKMGLNYKIEELWAAQNQDKSRPGISVIEKYRDEYGENDSRSFLLRRIFAKIQVNDLEDEITNTVIALSYNQLGFQLAFGPHVKICQNLSIMGADKFMSTYASDTKMPTPARMIEVLGDWLHDFEKIRKQEVQLIKNFREVMVLESDAMEMIGELTAKRIRKESNRFPKEPQPPLNQGQIGKFTETYLNNKVDNPNQIFSAWDMYNFATELYKPGETDFPLILSSNHAMSQYLATRYNLN